MASGDSIFSSPNKENRSCKESTCARGCSDSIIPILRMRRKPARNVDVKIDRRRGMETQTIIGGSLEIYEARFSANHF